MGMVIPLLLMVSCVYHPPEWNPENKMTPPDLEKSLAQAEAGVNQARESRSLDQPTTMVLTRDGVILSALARNKSLAVQKFSPRIATTRIPEALGAFDPHLLATTSYGKTTVPLIPGYDPLITRERDASLTLSQYNPSGAEIFLSGGLSRVRSSPGEPEYTGSWSVGVNQALLRGSNEQVNLVSLRQAENLDLRSRYELRGFVMDLVQSVEYAYWNLVLAKEKLKISEFSVLLAKEQLQLNKNFIAVGKLSRDALVSAEAELASREADLVDAYAEVKARTIDLIRLLDPQFDAQWSIVFETADPPDAALIDLNPDVSARLAALYRPELAQARLDFKNSELEIVRTKNGLLPKLDAFASYGRFSAGDSSSEAFSHLNDTRFENYEIGLSFETSLRNTAEKAQNQRAEFQKQMAEAALDNLEQLLQADVRLAAIEVDRQWQRIPATEHAVKSREEELRIERSRFLEGTSTNLDVLQVHRNLIQAQLDEVTSRIRYIEALTALYHAEGTLLARRGIGIDVEK